MLKASPELIPTHPKAPLITERELWLDYHIPNALENIRNVPHNLGSALKRLNPFVTAGITAEAALVFATGKPAISLAAQDAGLQQEGTDNGSVIASTLEPEFTAAAAPEFSLGNPFYRPSVWSRAEAGLQGEGYVATDGLRVTHVYNEENQQWEELENYIPIGTAQERMNRNLRELLNANVRTQMGLTAETNPLGFDSAEVERYILTSSDEGLKSFQVLNIAPGEPAIPLATGGSSGLREDIGNIEVFKQAFKRLLEIDPNAGKVSTTQHGLRAIAGDISPYTFDSQPTYSASFDAHLGVMEINEVTQAQRRSVTHAMVAILTEPRHIYNYHHFSSGGTVFNPDYRLSDNPGIDKGLYLKQWAEQNRSNMTSSEYTFFTSYGDIIVRNYANRAASS